ncbi:ribosome maturation factor RimM [Terriglobus aquaticus]|uniref:Ribosome maturation factor RimM n=1 Tax=Terriglobus aquaticus TaxID=940139 RepID=A0ABW9KIN9_9BACT|nr:ribosome maturation factor RimM [Terriglobus aquaticus]
MTTPSQTDWTLLAQAVRPQGRRGEILCDLHTDFPDRFADRRELFLRRGTAEPTPVQLENHWLPTGNSAGRVVLKFAGVDSIEAAEALAGAEIVVPTSQRVALGPDEFYISDLQGCTLVNVAGGDGPDDLGTITDVHFATDRNGRKLENATPVLVVEKPNGDEILIPLALEFLRNPDLANRRIEMALPGGLVEANG